MKRWTVDPRKQAVVDLGNCLAGDPPRSGWAKWVGGILIPVVVAALGAKYCLSREAVLVGRRGTIQLYGRDAAAMGAAWLSAAFFFHFHYFWGNLDRLQVWSDPGKTLSALAFVGAFGYVLWSIIMS